MGGDTRNAHHAPRRSPDGNDFEACQFDSVRTRAGTAIRATSSYAKDMHMVILPCPQRVNPHHAGCENEPSQTMNQCGGDENELVTA